MKISQSRVFSTFVRMFQQLAFTWILLVLISVSASAQATHQWPASPSEVLIGEVFSPIEGVVTEIQGNLMKLAGNISIDISRADIESITHPRGTVPEIKVGMKVTAFVKTGETAQSPLIAGIVQQHLEEEVVIFGKVQEIDPLNRTITVYNQKIKITDTTFFWRDAGYKTALSFEKLKANHFISVKAFYSGTDLIAAQVTQAIKAKKQDSQ
jgi:hypothetical protein